MLFYFLIFIILALLSSYCLSSREVTKVLCSVIVGLFLILIAGLRQPGTDLDSVNYQIFYDWVEKPLDYFTNFSKYSFYEAGYYLLPAVLKSVFNANVVWFFIIIALFGVSLKFIAIWRLSEFQMLSIFIYFCHFFFLHDMTQIRQGIASGTLLLAVPAIRDKRFFKFIAVLSLGIFFHYSTITFILFYFLNPNTLSKKLFFSILIIPQILHLLGLNIISIIILFNIGIITEKLVIYQQLLDKGIFNEINVYNAVVIVQLLFCVFLIWKSDFLQSKNQYAILLIKIYTFALSSWVLFASIPQIAFRISGFLGIVEIILVPYLLYYIEEKFIAILFVILFGFSLIYIDLIHSELLKPYEMIKLFG